MIPGGLAYTVAIPPLDPLIEEDRPRMERTSDWVGKFAWCVGDVRTEVRPENIAHLWGPWSRIGKSSILMHRVLIFPFSRISVFFQYLILVSTCPYISPRLSHRPALWFILQYTNRTLCASDLPFQNKDLMAWILISLQPHCINTTFSLISTMKPRWEHTSRMYYTYICRWRMRTWSLTWHAMQASSY